MTSTRSTILLVFGTRPEAIKLAPLVDELRRDRAAFDVRVCVTAQHREMLDQVLDLFQIRPDADLHLMREAQDLGDLATAVQSGVKQVIVDLQPRLMVVQGDTTTAMAAALAAFHEGVPVAHVEAGLRSFDDSSPWPEEVNRKVVSAVARLHFAPTEQARQNLLREGTDPARVFVTGNTVIDALQRVTAMLDGSQELRADLETRFPFAAAGRRMLLVTGHRRESFGAGLESICRALDDLAREFPDVEVVYPVHLNPNVRKPVHAILGGNARIHLIEPVDYAAFVHLMRRCALILTDSGGVQEEAPVLGKPVLVMRGTTERPEGVDGGTVRIIGTGRDDIVREAGRLLRDPGTLADMSRVSSPYGDGHAAERIAALLRDHLATGAVIRAR